MTFLRTVLLTSVLLSGFLFPDGVSNKMKGFYWMVEANTALDYPDDKFYQNYLPLIDACLSTNAGVFSGVYITLHWNSLEPEEGNFRFEHLDDLIKIVHKHHKFYKMALVPGLQTPAWLFQKNIAVYKTKESNPFLESKGKEINIPIPWDATYDRYFYRALQKLSGRYLQDEGFIAMAITVANWHYAEWMLPRSKADTAAFEEIGGFSKVKEVWMKAIDRYRDIFPNKQLCLECSSTPLLGMDAESRQILDHGAGVCPGQISFQINQLRGRRDMKGDSSYDKLFPFIGKVTLGMQNVAGWRSQAGRQGSMEMSVYNFLQARAEYWEVWYGEGMSGENINKLDALLKGAQRLGLEKYREQLEAEGAYLGPNADTYRPPGAK